MRKIQAYHRPKDPAEAAALLRREDIRTLPLAGGTQLVPLAGYGEEEIVDLQDLPLDHLEYTEGGLHAGALVRLQDLMDHEHTPALVRDMARYEGPNTFRNAATLGGVLAAGDAESELLAALLVHEASLRLDTPGGTEALALEDFLADRPRLLEGALILEARFPTGGKTASARVARTPMDRPIVAALGRRTSNGALRLALCGVAEAPVLVEAAGLETLTPPGDFRGGAPYRAELARVLTERVRAELEG